MLNTDLYLDGRMHDIHNKLGVCEATVIINCRQRFYIPVIATCTRVYMCSPFASKACFRASTSTLVCLLFSSLKLERLACIDIFGLRLGVACNVTAPVDDRMPPIDDIKFLAASLQSTISTTTSSAASIRLY